MALSLDRRDLSQGPSGWSYRACRARHCACTSGAHGAPIAVGVNTDGRREVLGMAIGASEAEPFWTELSRAILSAAASAA